MGTNRIHGGEELSLLYSEGAKGEMDGSPLLQQHESFQHGERIFAAGNGHGNPITFANHTKTMNSLAGLAQQYFLYIHKISLAPRLRRRKTTRGVL